MKCVRVMMLLLLTEQFLSGLDFGDSEVRYKSTGPRTDSLLTHTSGSSVKLRDMRPALIVSSTSWTEDEDFSMLLDAISKLDSFAVSTPALPEFVFVITGKGPRQKMYKEEIKNLKLKKCRILTAWLDLEDYPKLLEPLYRFSIEVRSFDEPSGWDACIPVGAVGCELEEGRLTFV
ncbi:mannosyltransferase [Irineochytrium annulatum]|nr:mannosyltransferase [Irineochytrium annulatum]